ncbi:MAG: TrmB family transcriptional regulator [Deltaproteobacteria bacterium]|nr:TrmB family transcriptional regulator [Deltaproteobacteria bacterium]
MLESLTLSLKQLGLSLNESKAYLCLLRKSGVTGYELSKNAGIPPSKIYDSLNKLLAKGFISAIKSNHPPKYLAIDSAEILERYKKEYNRTLDILKKQLGAICQRPEDFNQYIWHINGRTSILDKIWEIFESSQEMIYLSIWKDELEEVEEACRGAAKRGVKMAIVLYGTHEVDFGVVYNHNLDGLFLREMGERRLALAADDKIMLLGHFSEEGEAFATWTHNRGMVNLAKDYITHDIIALKLVKEFEPQINVTFGKKWERLRNVMVKEARAGRLQPKR